MSRISQLFGRLARPSAQAPSVNRAGYPAWERPLEEQYLQTLLTNTFGNTFYVKQKDLVVEAAALHDAMLAKDPAFVADAIVYARTRGFMRSQPLYGLMKLAGHPLPGLLERAFDEVVRTPDDLADFTLLLHADRGGEGGRRVKRLAGRWLAERLTEYWVMKYGAPKRAGAYALRDLVRVYHPDLSAKRALADYVLGRRGAALSTLPQLAALERLKRAKTDDERVAAITIGRLPHEVTTPFARSKAVWAAIAPQLPIFALLRHLATLERHGVLDEVRAQVERTFGSREAIARSKILPFRFVEASRHVRSAWAKDALRDALELSFANVPDLAGRTAIFLDRSGSMGAYVQPAAIFAVSLMKKARGDGRLMLFDDRLEELEVSMRDSLLTQAERVSARGGTDTALPMKQLLHERDRVDTIVLITDEQQTAGTPFADALDEYRRKVNGEVRTFILDVAPYRNAIVPEMPNTFFVYGWSDQALSFVSMASRGFGGMVEAVRRGLQ
jgi:60 kDa SS-A/Ro ribonucleoprotein